jgi:hypothetical protein
MLRYAAEALQSGPIYTQGEDSHEVVRSREVTTDAASPRYRYFWCASELRSGVKDWKEITPQSVQKAVDALRRRFKEQAWKVAYIMGDGCYPALHLGMSEQAKTVARPLRQLGLPALPTVDEGQSEPLVFKTYFSLCGDLLAREVQKTFSELLEIAAAQSRIINRDPVEWASLQIKVLVADESYGIALWTKNASDKQTWTKPPARRTLRVRRPERWLPEG